MSATIKRKQIIAKFDDYSFSNQAHRWHTESAEQHLPTCHGMEIRLLECQSVSAMILVRLSFRFARNPPTTQKSGDSSRFSVMNPPALARPHHSALLPVSLQTRSNRAQAGKEASAPYQRRCPQSV